MHTRSKNLKRKSGRTTHFCTAIYQNNTRAIFIFTHGSFLAKWFNLRAKTWLDIVVLVLGLTISLVFNDNQGELTIVRVRVDGVNTTKEEYRVTRGMRLECGGHNMEE